jgi:hypothetical protein
LGFAAFMGLIILISVGTAADSIAWWRWLFGY